MAITPVSKQQAMRPAEIEAIDALNAAITELNNLDISGLNTRLTTIETNVTNLTTRVGTAETDISSISTRVTGAEGDIDAIEATLYTNLDQTV